MSSNNKPLKRQVFTPKTLVSTHNGVKYRCLQLQPKGSIAKPIHRVSVCPTGGVPKTVSFNSNWDPLIEGAALAAEALAPELLPFIHVGKNALKNWMHGKDKNEHKHKDHKKNHESNFQKAFGGAGIQRTMTPPEFVQAYDGKKIPMSQHLAWKASRVTHVRHAFHGQQFPNVVMQSNIRQLVNTGKLVKPDGSEDHPAIADFARINKKSQLHEGSVPILQGDMGTTMDMNPVTITKTQDHAVIAGSELLYDLNVPTGAGVPGNNIMEIFINPRVFVGTKLAYEAQTWLQFRFRKLILEYVPTISANQAGAFIGYYTQDPNEQALNGITQRRNAMEHDHAVPFQPYSYVVFGMTGKEQDKILYYMDAEAGDEDRMSYQGKFLVTNNAQNTENMTYGTIIMHYEVDFYYPAISDAVSGAAPIGSLSVNAPNATNLINTLLPLTVSKANLPASVELGTIFTGILSAIPGTATSAYFSRPDPGGGINPVVQVGQSYLFKVAEDKTTAWWMYCYDSLSYASQPLGLYTGALFNGNPAAASGAAFTISNMTKLSPVLLDIVQNDISSNRLMRYQPAEDEEEEPTPIEEVPTTSCDLTISEADLIARTRESRAQWSNPVIDRCIKGIKDDIALEKEFKRILTLEEPDGPYDPDVEALRGRIADVRLTGRQLPTITLSPTSVRSRDTPKQ